MLESRSGAVTSRPTFAYVVPMRDAIPFLPVCLPALLSAASRAGAEVVLVDNGSTDGTRERAAQACSAAVRVIDAPGVTIAGARNRGAEACSADTLVFVDADCEVQPDHLAQVAAAFAASGADAVGAAYETPADPHWVEDVWCRMHTAADGPARHLPAGNFAVRRASFAAVGGFDESLTTGEDSELCQRLRQAGARIERHSRIRVVHHGNPKSLRAFFAKQSWHGLGMFSTTGRREIDKPVAAMTMHAVLVFVGLGLLFSASMRSLAGLFVIVAALNAVPVAAVAYRRGRHWRGGPSWWRAVLLYHLYFAARLRTAARIFFGRKVQRG